MLKSDARDCDIKVGIDGDSALPGRSPCEETAWRHLHMEQAVLRGKVVVQILWDMAKYFDSIKIILSIQRCEAIKFPID